LSGRLPFQAKSFGEMVIKHMTVTPKPVGSYDDLQQPIPAAVEDLVNALLEKDPDARPQTMAEVEEVLQGLVDYVAPVETHRTGQMPVLKRPSKPGIEAEPGAASADRSQRISAVPITREPTVDVAPAASGEIPSAATSAAASGAIAVVSLPGERAFVKRPPVRLLALVGCAMAAATLVTWLVMRGGNDERAPVANAPMVEPVVQAPSPSPPPPPPPVPVPSRAAEPAPITPRLADVATPATPSPRPPPPAPASTRKVPPPRPLPSPNRPKQVDRSGTMDVFGDP
jgi:serine/threonine protein kinase